MKSALSISLWLTLAFCGSAFAQAASGRAEAISNYRLKHGERRVAVDPALNRIANEQAVAMASRDVLDHAALRPLSSRVGTYVYEEIAENIAYGHDDFPQTLGQWIESPGHQRNLLLHDATKIGVASAKSAKTGRTYWAMVIAVGPPPAKRNASRHGEKPCRLQLLEQCL
jgi:uncharacterized protein YkwD